MKNTLKNFSFEKKLLFLWGLVLAVYLASHHTPNGHLDYFVPLADSFLHGQLNLREHSHLLNELIFYQGKYFVVYPPMPAILLMPVVLVFGAHFYQPLFSILIGSFNVILFFLVVNKLFPRPVAWGLTFLLAFGTMHYFHAVEGSAWYLAHIVAIFFLLLMLLEVFNQKRLWLVGLLIGCSFLSRLPAILSMVFVLSYCHQDFFNFSQKQINWSNLLKLGLGMMVFVILNMIYNYLRFGVFYDISYSLLPVWQEPWYQNGLMSYRNLPIHLKEMFWSFPLIVDHFPFVIPSIEVMALWVVTPAFLLIAWADFKQKIVWSSLVTVIVMSLPGLMHGSNGFTQFGFRFALDYLPFLLILVGSGMRGRLNFWSISLIILSIFINLYGLVMIAFLNIYSFRV